MKRIYTIAFVLFSFFFFFSTRAVAQFNDSYFDFDSEFPSPDPTDGEETVNNGGNALEVGVKFEVTHLGIINGIHYWKNSSNTGTHIANLWTNAGALLATANDGGTDLGVGWRYIEFATPVTVDVGNIYVASVFMPTGFYSATNNYFNQGPMAVRHLIHLLDDPAAQPPGNGLFRQNPTSAFPNSSFQATNYWVDVNYTEAFPLPVTLTDLKATPSSSDVLVTWKTVTETNNKGFEIQRSNNNSDWFAVKFVNSLGDGSITRNYSYTDRALAPGTYFYRLKQVDIDGKNTFSTIVSATIGGKGKTVLYQNFPNPISSMSTIRFDLPTTQKVKLSIVDMMGREVMVLVNKVTEAGSNLATINAAALQKQIYLVRLQTDKEVLTKTILVE